MLIIRGEERSQYSIYSPTTTAAIIYYDTKASSPAYQVPYSTHPHPQMMHHHRSRSNLILDRYRYPVVKHLSKVMMNHHIFVSKQRQLMRKQLVMLHRQQQLPTSTPANHKAQLLSNDLPTASSVLSSSVIKFNQPTRKELSTSPTAASSTQHQHQNPTQRVSGGWDGKKFQQEPERHE